MRFQAEKVTEKSDGGKNTKESLTKMNKNGKMKYPVQIKMVQRNIKVTKKAMKEGRSRKIEASTNEGNEENNLPRLEIGDTVLTRSPPISKILLLNQALVGELL
jgi:hypothetical protein